MPTDLKCSCGRILSVPDAYAGKRVRCPACQAVIDVPPPAANSPEDEAFPEGFFEGAPSDLPPLEEPAAPERWQYLVFGHNDRMFSGSFDPEKLQKALNLYGHRRWRLRGMATASILGLVGTHRDEIIFVMERRSGE